MQTKIEIVKYVMTYIKENTNINEHRRVIVKKLNNQNILESAYRDNDDCDEHAKGVKFEDALSVITFRNEEIGT